MSTATMKMRKFEFKPGTRNVTLERAAAIAWATNRRGRNPWKGTVTTDIRDYLAKQGYRPALSRDRGWVQSTLLSIERNGLGYVKRAPNLHPGGHANAQVIIEFNFHDDVDLNGQGLPAEASIEEKSQQAQLALAASVNGANELAKQGLATEASRVDQVLGKYTNPVPHSAGPAGTNLPGDRPVVQPTGVMPPLPGAPKPPPYGLDILVELLTEWAEKAPEDYAKWVEAATASLMENT